jgi:L-tartrate/succinate antiporter
MMGTTKTAIGSPAKAPGAAKQSKTLKWIIPLALGVIVYLIPVPAGLTVNAWRFFALFITVIAALISEPLPGAVIGFVGVAFAAVLGLVGNPEASLNWALSGYSNSTVWLIYAACLFALGYEVSGLGRRVALALVHKLGKRTLGLGYAIALSDLTLAPFTSSNTARASCTFPIFTAIPPLYGSSATENPRKIGSYIIWVAFATQCVSSSIFLTACAPNVLAIELAGKIANIYINWTSWFLTFLPVGVLLFLAVPLLSYIIYPPELKYGEEIAKWAGAQLKEMGSITLREKKMAGLAMLALVGWVGASKWIDPTLTALVVCGLMMLMGVVTWNDIAGSKMAWTNLVWLATLITMAGGLARVGFLKWFANISAGVLSKVPATAMMIGVIAVFFLVHYFFASLTAHTAALMPVFLAAMMTLPGLPLKPVTMVICYCIGLMGVISPYATGPAPMYYGTGYVSTKDFWRLGFIFGMIFLGALIGIELPLALKFIH